MQTQKGEDYTGISPPIRCLLTRKACEWTLCGSRVFAGSSKDEFSSMGPMSLQKQGSGHRADTGMTTLKTREELTPDKSRNPGHRAGKRPDQTGPSGLRSTSLLTPGLGPWPGLGQQSLLSSDPRALAAGVQGVMPSSWTVEEGASCPPPPGGPHICTSPAGSLDSLGGHGNCISRGGRGTPGGHPSSTPTVASYCTGPWLR